VAGSVVVNDVHVLIVRYVIDDEIGLGDVAKLDGVLLVDGPARDPAVLLISGLVQESSTSKRSIPKERAHLRYVTSVVSLKSNRPLV